MFCNQCGLELPDGSRFCSSCGAKLDQAVQSTVTPTYASQTKSNAQADEWYENGSNAFYRKNYVEANEWYRKAAEQGHEKAQYALAISYYNGYGVQKDLSIAIELWKKSAAQGNGYAKSMLEKNRVDGYVSAATIAQDNIEKAWNHEKYKARFEEGEALYGNSKTVKKAFPIMEELAKEGYPPAQFYLGLFYQFGNGCFTNLKKAVEWYEKAAAQGEKTAKESLEELKSEGKI